MKQFALYLTVVHMRVALFVFQEEKLISDRINQRSESKSATDQDSLPPLEEDTRQLLEVHTRLSAIGADSAESRAGAILHGLVRV